MKKILGNRIYLASIARMSLTVSGDHREKAFDTKAVDLACLASKNCQCSPG